MHIPKLFSYITLFEVLLQHLIVGIEILGFGAPKADEEILVEVFFVE